jgi:hypothetical protein
MERRRTLFLDPRASTRETERRALRIGDGRDTQILPRVQRLSENSSTRVAEGFRHPVDVVDNNV